MYGIKMPINVLAERLAMKAQMSTIYASYRPFGTSVIIGGFDELTN